RGLVRLIVSRHHLLSSACCCSDDQHDEGLHPLGERHSVGGPATSDVRRTRMASSGDDDLVEPRRRSTKVEPNLRPVLSTVLHRPANSHLNPFDKVTCDVQNWWPKTWPNPPLDSLPSSLSTAPRK